MEKIFESNYARVEYSEEGAYTLTTWLDKMTINADEYKAAFNATIDFQRKNPGKVRFFVSDLREQGIVSPENRKWLQEVALPETVSLKMEQLAVVSSANVFQRYYVNNILNSTKKFGIKLKFFSKPEEAIEWFKTF